MGMIQKMLLSLLVAALPLAGCAAEEGDALPTTSQAGEDAMQEQTGETGANAALRGSLPVLLRLLPRRQPGEKPGGT